MDINLQEAKIDLIQWLTTLEDASLIEKIMDLRKNETKDWWSEISTAEQNSIELGIAEAENNELRPHTEARKIYEKWL